MGIIKKFFKFVFLLLDIAAMSFILFGAYTAATQSSIDGFEAVVPVMAIVGFFMFGYPLCVPLYLLSGIFTFLHGYKEIDGFGDFFRKLVIAPFFVFVRIFTRIGVLFGKSQNDTRKVLHVAAQVCCRLLFWLIEAIFALVMIFGSIAIVETSDLFSAFIPIMFIIYILSGISIIINAIFAFLHGNHDYDGFGEFISAFTVAPIIFALHFISHTLALFGAGSEYDVKEYDDYEEVSSPSKRRSYIPPKKPAYESPSYTPPSYTPPSNDDFLKSPAVTETFADTSPVFIEEASFLSVSDEACAFVKPESQLA